MLSVGIDIGSVAAKAVVFDASRKDILSGTVLPTSWNYRQATSEF
jgi:activator of 2-hydroxyglutaryl-CoA dehydratase